MQFTECISEINTTQVDNAKGPDVATPMYNSLIECCDNCSKTTGSLWQYYRDETDDTITNSRSFKSKVKITDHDGNTKNVEIAVSLQGLI